RSWSPRTGPGRARATPSPPTPPRPRVRPTARRTPPPAGSGAGRPSRLLQGLVQVGDQVVGLLGADGVPDQAVAHACRVARRRRPARRRTHRTTATAGVPGPTARNRTRWRRSAEPATDPPIRSEWPEMYFDVECRTRRSPASGSSAGRSRKDVATVLSTTSGT